MHSESYPFNDLFREGYTIGIGILDSMTGEPSIELCMNQNYQNGINIIYSFDGKNGTTLEWISRKRGLKNGKKGYFPDGSAWRLSKRRCDGLYTVLENEKETIRVLTKKESSGIKAQLEKEKAAGEELREALLS